MKIAITNFVRRQTAKSQYTHWNLFDDDFLKRVYQGFDKAVPGYRDGVVLVPVNPGGFYCGIVKLKSGDKLSGSFVARKDGEDPRKSVYAHGSKVPAVRVDVVLYSHAVLAENNENETDADWEIVSVNGSPIDGPVPMSVGTLIANHFEFSGGTSTRMSDAEFVSALKKSAEFWKDKALVAPID